MNTCCSEINFLLELPHDNILDMSNIFQFCKILAKNINKSRFVRTKINISSWYLIHKVQYVGEKSTSIYRAHIYIRIILINQDLKYETILEQQKDENFIENRSTIEKKFRGQVKNKLFMVKI